MEFPENTLNSWLLSKDCYGNRMVQDWELPLIKKRLLEIEDLSIVQGNIETDTPNQILVDITYLKPKKFQPNKKVIITLSHFLRPCLCSGCIHDHQYECYLNECKCCSGDCT